MTKGTALNNSILLEVGKRWPTTIRLWRRNVGSVKIEGEGDNAARFVRFGIKGESDLQGIIWPSGRWLAVETKTPGDRLNQDQKDFRDMIVRFGGVHIVARTVEDFVEKMQAAMK